MNQSRYALVTGATSGIGYELAKLFAADGYNLILVARTEEDLEKTSKELSSTFGVEAVSIAKDLFGEHAATELYQEVKSRNLTVDVLVNNAGQGVYGPFTETDLEAQIKIIHLNIVSLTTLTYHFLKEMVARNEGKILQLASVVSDMPAPLQSVYGGTKAYVLSFTEALVNELKDSAVTITALQPGVTDTGFFQKAGAENSKMAQDKSKMADPAQVAKDGYKALMKGKDSIVSGLKNKAGVALSHILPDTVAAEQVRKRSEETNTKKENP